MPVLLPLLVPLLLILSAIVMMVLQQTVNIWLRPIIKVLTANHHNFFVKIILAPAKLLAKGITAIEHSVAASIGSYVGAQLKPMVKWMNGLAAVAGETPLHIGGLAEATYNAFNTLRHTTVPKLIKAAVDPIRVIAVRADNTAKLLDTQIDTITANLGKALSTAEIGVWTSLNNQLVGWARAYDNLHQKVWADLVPDIAAIKAQLFQTVAVQIDNMIHSISVVIPAEFDEIRTRIGAIENFIQGLGAPAIPLPGAPSIPLPGDVIPAADTILDKLKELANPLVFAGAAVAAITAFAPSLFCKNTLKAAQNICSMNDDLLDDLLFDAVLVAEGLSILELIREGQELAGAAFGVLEGLE